MYEYLVSLMVNHDYKCPACGFLLRDHKVSIHVGAKAGAPECPKGCIETGGPITIRVHMAWIPQVQWMDALEPMQEFMATDTYGKPVLVDSVRKLRQIEDESRRECASNPGNAQLLNWRDYSNDTSNSDACTIAKHMDRSMDDQGERLEADPAMVRQAITEREAESVAGPDVPFSGGDVLGEG